MKKVTIKIMGGLGNQLHCYSFGKAVAHLNKSELLVDSHSGYWHDEYDREFLLNYFPNYSASRMGIGESKSEKIYFKLKKKILQLLSSILPLKAKILVTEECNPYHFQEELINTNFIFNPYFEGYWASYKYYKSIKHDLQKEFIPPMPTNSSVLQMAQQIEGESSCAIHIRSYKEESGVQRADMKEYYMQAISQMKNKLQGIKFFIFSDDLQFAKDMLHSSMDDTFIFVDLNVSKGNVQSFNDFYLIYIADNAIIGDSTFSWWAAWLSDESKDFVIAPRGLSPWGDDWLPDNWIAIKSV